MAAEFDNWLKQLALIEKALADLIPESNLWVLFSLSGREPSDRQTLTGRPDGESGVLYIFSLVPKYTTPDDGGLWFDVGRGGLPAVVCWDTDSGLSLHDSLPEECLTNGDGLASCVETWQWGTLYLLRGGGDQRTTTCECIAEGLVNVEEAALAACASAPTAVLATVGDMSLGHWPTALFYLAIKGVHPMLTADDAFLPAGPPEKVREENADITRWAIEYSNGLGIMLSADLRTATGYAFDALRQMAGDGVAEEGRPAETPGDIPDEKGFVKDGSKTPKKVWERFDIEMAPPTFDGQPLVIGTGLERDVLVKLVNARGRKVPYAQLDSMTHGTAATEQLRRAKSVLTNRILKDLPVTIMAHRGEGYSLKPK